MIRIPSLEIEDYFSEARDFPLLNKQIHRQHSQSQHFDRMFKNI